jgi:hypothetical protein
LAEVIKYGVICDEELFTYIEENLDRIKSLDDIALETIVFRSAKIKAELVEKDERDFGIRNILSEPTAELFLFISYSTRHVYRGSKPGQLWTKLRIGSFFCFSSVSIRAR